MSEERIGDGALPSAGMEDAPKRKRRKAPGEAAGTRAEDDAYDTPEALALACVEWCVKNLPDPTDPAQGPGFILEPCAGKGPFVKAARNTWPDAKIVAIDIRPECQAPNVEAGAIFACFDSTHLSTATIAAADLIISNFPFKIADELVRRFWAYMKDGAVMASILSVTFLGSKDRWEEEPPGLFKIAPLSYVVPIVPRPDFGITSPKFEAGLFVWVKGDAGANHGAIIPPEPIRWAKPKRTRAKKSENGGVP
jgi:hypothetical protein